MTARSGWIRSRRSQNGTHCVELSHDLNHIRDSKDPAGPILTVNARTLLQAIRQGRFDR